LIAPEKPESTHDLTNTLPGIYSQGERVYTLWVYTQSTLYTSWNYHNETYNFVKLIYTNKKDKKWKKENTQ
jgi:hypothetical protein